MKARNQFSGCTVLERFESFVRTEPNTGCWLWAGGNSGAYGAFYDGKQVVKAHRWSYEHFCEPIASGLVLDHICCVPQCVNPTHLRPVTQRQNILFGTAPAALQAKRTHCIHGHALDEINTYIKPNGSRQCKACRRATDARRNNVQA